MNNPILYLRTSTKDQHPELQEKSGIEFCERIGLGTPEVFSEQGSAYKLEKVRPIWEKVIETAKKEKKDIIVWKYDRAFRNKKKFYEFMKVMFEVYGTKVYSVTEPSILSFWKLMGNSYSEDPIMNEFLKGIFKVFWNFAIQLAGEQAEDESRKKSERVKLAVRKKDGKTISYKGNKWGRKSISKKTVKEILNLKSEGLSVRRIASKIFIWDKNNNKKLIGKSTVHKILAENVGEKQ